MCVVFLQTGGPETRIGLVLEPVIQRRLKGFPVLYVAYTVNPSLHLCCRLPSFLTLNLSKSSPTPLFTICSLFPSHTIAIFAIHFSLPSSSVCFPDSFFPLLFTPLISLVCFLLPINPLPSLHPFFFSSLSQSVHTPREKCGSDEHGEPGTNQSIDLSMYPSLCSSDRQQKTKCLLSETFPISFDPLPSPSHYPPHLVMESLFLGPVHPAETCPVFQLHFFSKVHLSGFLTSAFLHLLPYPVHLYCQFKVALYCSQRESTELAFICDDALQQSGATRRRVTCSGVECLSVICSL